MIIDLILAAYAGVSTESFFVFVFLMVLSVLLADPDRPFSSGLFRLAFIALGISALSSLFGGDCDCDL
ncbi:hypothetical protein [Sulfuricystis multivorans]|uniref:hypothetical protein n=1 Tax=Sulfuricystis multivorans TaxID=2211108 RepID=UPI000F81FB7C|nr:hypothetical protein [Sulfuricystis multivorans]